MTETSVEDLTLSLWKGGVAVQLACAAALREPQRDVTWIFYDNEEVAAELNGLGRIGRERPELLSAADAALQQARRSPDRIHCVPLAASQQAGSGDTMKQVYLTFPTQEAAVAYCEARGLSYEIEPAPTPAPIKPKVYADNFRYGRAENWSH